MLTANSEKRLQEEFPCFYTATSAATCKHSNVQFVRLKHLLITSVSDFWDPLWLNSLAAAREIVIFDNAGVGRSSGEVPTTFQGWADDVLALIHALGYEKIDLLGFSMGGVAVQMVALNQAAQEELMRAGSMIAEIARMSSDVDATAASSLMGLGLQGGSRMAGV